jgi:non-ribosomal peptide synthetase component F
MPGLHQGSLDRYAAAQPEKKDGTGRAQELNISLNLHGSRLKLPMSFPAEQQKLSMDLNDTERDSCIHELFEAQVERTPDAVAVVFENQQLTYRELNAGANQLAHHLRALGVAPEVLVGICVERSLEMVVGVMGILKAGGAYVPIDPAYPTERIAFMVEDSGMRLLLTQERLLKDLSHTAHRAIPMEHLGERTGLKSRENLAPLTRPQNLAYVIYTSGSTGRPKGVEVEHKSLVNLLHSMRRKTGMTDQDILLSVTTISFDMAVLDLFLPVMVGARVALVSREVASDGRRLKEQLENTNITVMQATPATWRMLLEACWKGAQIFQVL